MQILTDLSQQLKDFYNLFNKYDSEKTNQYRFLIENYNDFTNIIETINNLRPNVKNEFDISSILDSEAHSQFLEIHRDIIKTIENFTQNSAKVVELVLVFIANQHEGDKFHIPNVNNTSPREDLLIGIQKIIENVKNNDDIYLKELIDSSLNYQKTLQKDINTKPKPNQQP